jgi:hypothetical protein
MKTVVIIAFIFSTTLCFGQASMNTNANLENDFSKSTLGEENVTAFEARAKQKVVDYCNYIQLISDKDLDEKLRLHSQKSAMTLFNSSSCSINDSIISGSDSLIVISDFFKAVYETKFHKIEGVASDIILLDELTVLESGDYAGTISYTQTLTCYDEAGRLANTVIENKIVAVTLSRKTKAFGTTEKIIWTVNLCDIKTA